MCGCNHGGTPPTVVYVDLSPIQAGIGELKTLLEEFMATANEQLVELKAQIADTTADVLAKLDQLQQQVGTLPPDAQATLDEIKAGVAELDAVVGDADGSDTPTEPPVEPVPGEPTA